MKQSAVELFKQKIAAMKEQGLQNLHFSVEKTEGLTAEQLAEELNRCLDAVANDDGEPLVFNDSKKISL